MNIKASYRYQIQEHTRAICIYYFVVLCVYTLLFLALSVNHAQEDSVFVSGDFNGIELATAIFLFVSGLCSFKEAFGMMLQNGVSRRTIFTGRILAALTVAAGMAFIDQILSFVLETISNISHVLNYKTIFETIYSQKVTNMGTFQLIISNFLFAFFLYLFLMAAGYLITLLFYRLNVTGKIIIGVGVPIGLFTVLPIFDTVLTGGRIYAAAIVEFIAFAFGSSTQQPISALITSALAFLLFSGFSWLLIRRSPVRG